ncbi:MAG: sialidase family protein [Georgfuchsia sp.]
MKRKVFPLLVFIAATAWCWPRLQPLPASSFFSPAPDKSTVSPVADLNLHSELLPRAGASAHAVSLAQRGDGKLIAAWFAGSREGAGDVAIYSSVYENNAWSAPQRIVDRQHLAHDTQRLIRKLGNPLLWRAPDNVLHLWFVSVSCGGWAGSAINHMQSSDDGQHWSSATRIISSPFWNLSTLVRNPPLALADGGIALPAYHELLNKRPEWLRFDRHMQLVDKTRIPGSSGTLQPAAAALDQHRTIALLRDGGPAHRIQAAHSENAGSDWSPAAATTIPNPNAAIALIRLANGSLLLACNPLEANRNQLALLHSRDEGKSWSAPYFIEQGTSEDEFSYPALLQDDTGIVHLAYTWKRQAIKHVALSPAQIEAMP